MPRACRASYLRYEDSSRLALDRSEPGDERHGPALCRQVGTTESLVFPTASGKWQCINNWRNKAFSKARLAADLVVELDEKGRTVAKPKYSPYDLRIFYASMLIEQGMNIKRIQKLMGHTNVTTTLNIYGHLIERAEDEKKRSAGLLAALARNPREKSSRQPRADKKQIEAPSEK